MKLKNIKKLLIIMVVVCISLMLYACTSNKNNDKTKEEIKKESINKPIYVGVFITYGTTQKNENQQKLEKKEKVYGKIEHNKDESLRLELKDIKGVAACAYPENLGTEDAYVDSILGKELLDTDIELENTRKNHTKYEISSDIKINNIVDKDVTLYFNPVYLDKENKIYVTSKNAIKDTIHNGNLDDKNYDFREVDFKSKKDKNISINIELDIEYASEKESKNTNKEDILITENQYKKDERIGEDNNLFDNDAFDNLEEEYRCHKCLDQIEDYHAYDTIVGSTDNGFKLAPNNYDGDVEYYKEYIQEAKYTNEAEFYEMTITNTEKIKEKEYKHHCNTTKINKKQITKILKDSNTSALLWFNNQKEITKMIIIGITTTSE